MAQKRPEEYYPPEPLLLDLRVGQVLLCPESSLPERRPQDGLHLLVLVFPV